MKKTASRGLLSLNSDIQYDVISQTVERKSLVKIATRFHEPTLADLGKEALEKFEAGRRQTLARLQAAAQESEALSSLHQPTLAELARNIQAEFKVASIEWVRDLRATLERPTYELFRLERSTLEGLRERLARDLSTLRQVETDDLDPTEAEAIHQTEAAGEAVGTALDRAMATIECQAATNAHLAGAVATLTLELAQEKARNSQLENENRKQEECLKELRDRTATYERKCSRLAEGGRKRGRPPQTEEKREEIEEERRKRDIRLEGEFNQFCSAIRQGGGPNLKERPIPLPWMAELMLKCGFGKQTDTLQPYTESTLAKQLGRVTTGKVAWPKGRPSQEDGRTRDEVVHDLFECYKRGAGENTSGARPRSAMKNRTG